jgi:membrane protease YdiL (CAAX protease family)
MFLAKTRRVEIPWFIAYLLLVFASRAVADIVVWPSVVSRYITNPYLEPLVSALWRILFWVIPAFLYLIYVNRCNPWTSLKLTTNIGKGLLWALAGCLWFALALSFRHVLQGIPINLKLGFGDWLDMVVLVGFVEEIPFRAFVFQKLNEFMGFWPASLLSSFLFMCMHLPASPYTALYIFVFAWILCVVLKRSGSLWGCIIIHGLNDLLSLIV